MTYENQTSACCDARLILGDICSDCHEHSGPMPHHEAAIDGIDREAEADVVGQTLARAFAYSLMALISFGFAVAVLCDPQDLPWR